VYFYPPRGASIGLPVLYLHGVQSHPAWFAGSGAYLAGRGHAVYQVTRRGSGENSRDRGHASSAGQLLEDVEAACWFVLERSGADRLHLMGVSWGGKLLAAFAAERSSEAESAKSLRERWAAAPQERIARERIASLTLIAPGIVPLVDIRPWTKLAAGASALFCPRREFDIPLGEPELFTGNEPMQRYIREDPLSLRRATARFLLASRMLDRMLARAPRGAIETPTRLILASRDRIIDSEATRQAVARLTADRCEVTLREGSHTLEFEADPLPLYEALAGGIQRVPP
jgi:alpha-beta hydrolase superfamily lysophospholipase